MDFKQLRSYEAVVRYGSFTTAAEKLYLSQPTISTHIRQLEEELNAQLIIRTTKSIEISAKGREIYDYAIRILQIKNRMEECCETDSSHQLHIGASTIPSSYVLPGLLSEYQKTHPDIHYDIRQTDSQGVFDGLAQSLFDIGLAGKDPGDPDLVTIPICRDRMVLITPATAEYRTLKNKKAGPPDLHKKAFISREEGSGSLAAADRLLDYFRITPEELQICARINDTETIKNMVAAGLGVSIISERAAENFIKDGKILCFELPEEISIRNLYLCYRKGTYFSQETMEFLEFIKKTIRLS